MFEKINNYPIGIDIQERQILAVQLQSCRPGLAIKALAHAEIGADWQADAPAQSIEALKPPLKKIANDKSFRGKRVVLHIPSQQLISFPIRFQAAGTENLEEAILQESAPFLPFPIEEAIIDYPSLETVASGDTPEYKAVMIAVHRDIVENYVGLLKQVGLSVEAVDFQVSSLIRLHHHLAGQASGPIVLCHLGLTQTLLVIVSQDSILAQRYVSTGLQFMLGQIADNLALTQGKSNAKGMLQKYGLVYQDQSNENPAGSEPSGETSRLQRVIYQLLSPQLEELLYELHKIIGYVRSEAPNTVFEKMYVYGPGVLIRKLDDYLAGQFNIPTQSLNPLHAMEISNEGILIDPSEGGPLAMAVGLAMRKVPWL